MELPQFDLSAIWPYVLSVLTLVVIPFLVSGDQPTGVVGIVNAIKNRFNLEGNAARWVTFGVSLGLSALIGLVDGALAVGGELTPERFTVILSVLIASSQYWYSRLEQPEE